MKRTNDCVYRTLTTAGSMSPAGGMDDNGESTVSDRARSAREAVRSRQPLRTFDARAIREQSMAAPTDQALLRRIIRRSNLRQIVPLTDSTIYELEGRGAFPSAFPRGALRSVGPGRGRSLGAYRPAARRARCSEEGAGAGFPKEAAPNRNGEQATATVAKGD